MTAKLPDPTALATPADELIDWHDSQLQLTLPAGMVATLADGCRQCPDPTGATRQLARTLPRRTPGGPRQFTLDETSRAQWHAAASQLAADAYDRPTRGAAATLAKLLERAAALHPDTADIDRRFAAIVDASFPDRR